MARSNIAEKMADLLKTVTQGWDEAHVVYFFVELRKLLDHKKEATQQDLPHLRFYCDWVVHISKDRIEELTLSVIKEMEDGISRQIHSPYMYLGREAIDFTYFRSLGEEMAKLLGEEGLDTEILANEDNWVSLISTLVKVLEGQPLHIKASLGLNIKSIIFLPSAPNCVIMRVDFNRPVADKDGAKLPFYTLKNAF